MDQNRQSQQQDANIGSSNLNEPQEDTSTAPPTDSPDRERADQSDRAAQKVTRDQTRGRQQGSAPVEDLDQAGQPRGITDPDIDADDVKMHNREKV